MSIAICVFTLQFICSSAASTNSVIRGIFSRTASKVIVFRMLPPSGLGSDRPCRSYSIVRISENPVTSSTSCTISFTFVTFMPPLELIALWAESSTRRPAEEI